MISARGRPPPGSPDLPPSGREISGLEEMWAIRWSPPISLARLAVVEERVAGGVAGAVEHLHACGRRTRARRRRPAGVVTLRRAAPGAERARHRAQRGDDVARDPVAQHQRLRELVVALGVGGEVLDHRGEQVERADLGVRAAGEDADQPEVVDVLVGDDDPLQVLDPVAEVGQRALELVERLARVRPDVDQRQRVVLDQVAVDPPDHERRRDRERADHERMRRRTSSRFASMSSWETSDSSVRRSSGSVFDGRTLKCQSS